MKFERIRLQFAGAALAAFAVASFPAVAAMPVTGVSSIASDSAIIQVAAKKKKMTRRQEADQSAKDGTVPARYRANVPKEYHQYIPFAKQ